MLYEVITASRFQGGYSDLIKGVNTLVENVETPINETVSVIEQFAVNNFSARMKGSYEGSDCLIPRQSARSRFEARSVNPAGLFLS